ncbi:uncharacterized protein LOC141813501 [Curcuma longa]|uniref:uncharacterized protein LOC141813501 n=1 Tax=Curcuma longa TaxID=136217 RepID=UPI003D9FA6E7
MEHQPSNKKPKTLLSFFMKRDEQSEFDNQLQCDIPLKPIVGSSTSDLQPPSVSGPIEQKEEEFDISFIERDPGLRKLICEYPVNERDEIRRAYIKAGPYQPKLVEYPRTKIGKQNRRFQYAWFKQFPWLEYSPSKDKAYCFPCFLFENTSNSLARSALVSEGFNSWKRVNDGEKCAFLIHVGSLSSSHNRCVKCVQDLMKPKQNIDKVMNAQSAEEIVKNRLRLKATIEGLLWLATQGCPFRGHDESESSLNRGNFIELLKFQAHLNDEIAKVVLHNAPQNAKYTSPQIQKEILHILANKVRIMIRDELGDAKFCILVDEAQDESKKEQMTLILRFVNNSGFLVERFFEILSVEDTTSANLKKSISDIFVQHNIQIHNMRGQGYDGASNMRGEWNGLQALFLRDCPYAYYVHCFAHRLQLTLVAAAKDVPSIWQFFSYLTSIVNFVTSSPKRLNDLQSAQQEEIAYMLAIGERKSGTGANQVGTLHRSGATRWSSHYDSVRNLIDMYAATCKILGNLSENGPNGAIRGEASGLCNIIMSFEFVFVLFLMEKILETTDILCQALQNKSQDIVNALKFVSTTKAILLKFREDGWDEFFEKVKAFCERHNIEMPNMSGGYKVSRYCQQRNHVTVEHHYHYDIFNAAIDFQMMELNYRFSEATMELLALCSALDPTDSFKKFNVDDICKLASKFYPMDFTQQEIHALKAELEHYQFDIVCDPEFQQISTLSALYREMIVTKKAESYVMIQRLIRLVLTLPVSTATAERAFSAMKFLKTTRRNKMDDDLLSDCMILYIERQLSEKIDLESIIDEFYTLKSRRAQLK